MPPKKLLNKDTILKKAFEITRSDGFDALTARSLAASLGCSTQPIYQAFADRKALEKAVAEMGLGFMLAQMRTAAAAEALPREVAFALAYIRFALDETHLFRVIAQNGLFAACANPGDAIDPKLIIFANGVVFMSVFQSLHLTWDETRHTVMEAYAAFRKDGGGQDALARAPERQRGEETV